MQKHDRISLMIHFICVCCLVCLLAVPALAKGETGVITTDQVRLRKAMESTDVWTMLNAGNTVEILNTHKYQGTTYYYVTCHHPTHPERQYWGYVDASFVSMGGYVARQTATPSPAPAVYPPVEYPTAAPAADQPVLPGGTGYGAPIGQIRFTARGVNLRKRPNSEAKVLGQFALDQVTAYYGATVSDGHTWYMVNNGEYDGYVMADYAQIISGSAQTTATPAPAAPYYTAAPAATAAPSSAAQGNIALTNKEKVIVRAEGRSNGTQIKLLNRSGQVCTLLGPTVQADGYTWYNLKVKDVTGWIRGDLLRILSAQEAAAYIQGGSSQGGSTALNKVEMADWNTSDIQTVFYKGCVATVTDVRTGISFRVKRWSGGSHADVEPLTASDTAAMCRIYGVSKAQEIADRDLYQRRAILVTIGSRTFAASMYGVPHNASEGNTIKDNNFPGQFCIHFTNSTTHGSKKVDADHQAAIQEAYERGQSLVNGQ